MGVYIPNMEKPKSCGECKFFCGLGYGFHCYLNGKHITFIGEVEDFCPLIEIDDTVWENEKYKLIRMTQEARINKEMAERRADEHTD